MSETIKKTVNLSSDIITPIRKSLIENILQWPYQHTTRTSNGITWTDNGDGTITANGTIADSGRNANFNCSVRIVGATRPVILPAGTYRLDGCPVNGSIATWFMKIGCTKDDAYYLLGYDVGGGCTFTLEEDTQVQVQLLIHGSYTETITDLTFAPTLRLLSYEEGYDDGFDYGYCPNGLRDWATVSKGGANTQFRYNGVHNRAIAYGHGRFVAATTNGIYYSDDGKNWTCAISTIKDGVAVVYGHNGMWTVGTRANGLFFSTDNAETWTSVASGQYECVNYSNGKWFAWPTNYTTTTGLYIIISSNDWDTVTHLGNFGSGILMDIWYENGYYMALARPSATGTTLLLRNSNYGLLQISNIDTTIDTTMAYTNITYGDGIMIACALTGTNSDSSLYIYSTDGGKTWSHSAATYSLYGGVFDIHYTGAYWVMATTTGLYYSRDAINWTIYCSVTNLTFGYIFSGGGIAIISCSSAKSFFITHESMRQGVTNIGAEFKRNITTNGQQYCYGDGVWVCLNPSLIQRSVGWEYKE